MKTAPAPVPSFRPRFFVDAVNPPQMPRHIWSLVLPSQLKACPPAPLAKAPRKTKAQKRRERRARTATQQAEFLDSSSDEDNETVAAVTTNQATSNRYVPRFDAEKSDCWWEWIPLELDEQGRQQTNFQAESERAWEAFHRENRRREELQRAWWDKNPQHL